MTTSGVATFDMDLSEVIEDAFERAGSELRSGYDMRTARRSLNIMFADWANRGINMWTIEQGSFTLTQGLNTYALPTDTVDLLEHVIRTDANQSVAATVKWCSRRIIGVEFHRFLSLTELADWIAKD